MASRERCHGSGFISPTDGEGYPVGSYPCPGCPDCSEHPASPEGERELRNSPSVAAETERVLSAPVERDRIDAICTAALDRKDT
jgi:hypothetical protein